jgi:hypothetical protein
LVAATQVNSADWPVSSQVVAMTPPSVDALPLGRSRIGGRAGYGGPGRSGGSGFRSFAAVTRS